MVNYKKNQTRYESSKYLNNESGLGSNKYLEIIVKFLEPKILNEKVEVFFGVYYFKE